MDHGKGLKTCLTKNIFLGSLFFNLGKCIEKYFSQYTKEENAGRVGIFNVQCIMFCCYLYRSADRVQRNWGDFRLYFFSFHCIRCRAGNLLSDSDYAEQNGMFLMSAFFLSSVILMAIYLTRKERVKEGKGFMKKYASSAVVDVLNAF